MLSQGSLPPRHKRFITGYLKSGAPALPCACAMAPQVEAQPKCPMEAGMAQQVCSQVREMSGEKMRKHGHLWTFVDIQAPKTTFVLREVLEMAKVLLMPGGRLRPKHQPCAKRKRPESRPFIPA